MILIIFQTSLLMENSDFLDDLKVLLYNDDYYEY